MPCGFKSRPRHHRKTTRVFEIEGLFFLRPLSVSWSKSEKFARKKFPALAGSRNKCAFCHKKKVLFFCEKTCFPTLCSVIVTLLNCCFVQKILNLEKLQIFTISSCEKYNYNMQFLQERTFAISIFQQNKNSQIRLSFLSLLRSIPISTTRRGVRHN